MNSSTTRDGPLTERPRRQLSWRAVAVFAVVVLLIAVLTHMQIWTALESAPPRWNVLLITLDTTRADRIGCYGYEHTRTRTIDQLAEEGIRYSRCYSPVPLTLPAHASIMTGLYPFDHTLRINGAGRLHDSAATLAELLQAEGYSTAAIVAAFVLHSKFGLDQGFDSYDEDFSSGSAQSSFFYVERNAEVVTDAAVTWLATAGPRPYFLWVHYFDPHAPYEPPGYKGSPGRAAAYDAEIAYADEQLRRLLARVREIDAETGRETLIVFTADHGEGLWNHGEPTHGLFTYNDTLHVPLIVRFPSDAPSRARIIDTPVSLVDIYPSILAWLGIAPPHETRGRVLPRETPDADANSAAARALYFESQLPLEAYGWSPLAGVLLGNEKFIEAPRPERYALDADPLEANNLYEPGSARSAALRDELSLIRDSRLDYPSLAAERLAVDDETRRKLEALGYVGGEPRSVPPAGELADPKDMVALHREIDRARLAIESDDPQSAAQLLRGVLAADPGNGRAIQLSLHLLTKPDARGEISRVLEQLAPARLPSPLDLQVPLRLGVAALRANELAQAEEQLERARRVDPNDPGTNFYLALALSRRGNAPDVTLPLLRRACRSAPANREYALALGEILELSGDYAQALTVYTTLIGRDPDDAVAMNNAAWACYELGDNLEAALRHAEHAVALEPDNANFRDTLGCVLSWGGRPRDALEHLRRAVAIAPEHAGAHYHLGLAREQLSDEGGAVSALRRAVDLAGSPPPVWYADAVERISRLSPPE